MGGSRKERGKMDVKVTTKDDGDGGKEIEVGGKTYKLPLSDKAREAIFESFHKLYEWAAKKYGPRSLPRDEQRQIARIAGWHAFLRWDPEKSPKPSSYITKTIYRALQRAAKGEVIHTDVYDLEYRLAGGDAVANPEMVLILSEQLTCRTEEAQEEMDGMVEAAKSLPIRTRRDNVSAAEVADMLQSGMKQSQIAVKVGLTRSRIGQIVREIHEAVAAAKAAKAAAEVDDEDEDEDEDDEDAVAAGKGLPETEEEKENE